MPGITGEITIARPVEEVFDFVADETKEPQYNPDMVRADRQTDGPIGTGTRYSAAVRSGGRTTEMTIEVTAYERPTLLASATTLAQADIAYVLRFEPVPEGTRMRWTGQVRPHGALRLLGPLVTWVGARQERRNWERLKAHLEAVSPP